MIVTNLEADALFSYTSEAGATLQHEFQKGSRVADASSGDRMPNQKQRKKKDGENKNKKLQAMRAKEALAKPAGKPSATGQGIGETSKRDMVKDRPGGLKRA